MPISIKDRKNLWAKSGNRCAICKEELFQTNIEKTLNIGDECHIISSQNNGPRYIPNLSDYDNYENFILLCKNHHKEIDTLTDTYTEEILRFIKQNHENWVSNKLNEKNEKLEKARFLRLITRGKELYDIIFNAGGWRMDFDNLNDENEVQLVSNILQNLQDYIELNEIIEIGSRIEAISQFKEYIDDLEKNNFIMYAEINSENVRFSNDDSLNLKIATIFIKRKY